MARQAYETRLLREVVVCLEHGRPIHPELSAEMARLNLWDLKTVDEAIRIRKEYKYA